MKQVTSHKSQVTSGKPKSILRKNFLSACDLKLSAYRGGYSLVELMVAVTIFSLVAVVSISALISVNDANKKAQSMRAIIDNLNFAVENMARNLRVGSNYYCGESLAFHAPADCSLSGGSAISFRDYNNNWVVYRLNSTAQIEKSVNSGAYLPLTPYNASVALQPLSIDYLRFYVSGSPAGDGLQPRVVVVIQGTAIYNVKIQTRFQLQTSISQRKIDS